MSAGDSQRLDKGNTALVVDSTADLPQSYHDDPNLSMVPLSLHFGEEMYQDWVDIDAVTFYQKLRAADKLPTTSQPPAGAFVAEYQRLRGQFDHVFSLHLSALLSGTYASATTAELEVDGVTVVDTELVSLGMTLLVDRLLSLLKKGVDETEFLDYIENFKKNRGFLFQVATLEYLQKGGRIGRASSIAGGLLHIKPLLTIEDGVVDAYKKVRGEKKAMREMEAYFLERTHPEKSVLAGVAHADAPDKMDELAEMLLTVDRDVDIRFRGEVGPVIGTYAGPGAAALTFIQE